MRWWIAVVALMPVAFAPHAQACIVMHPEHRLLLYDMVDLSLTEVPGLDSVSGPCGMYTPPLDLDGDRVAWYDPALGLMMHNATSNTTLALGVVSACPEWHHCPLWDHFVGFHRGMPAHLRDGMVPVLTHWDGVAWSHLEVGNATGDGMVPIATLEDGAAWRFLVATLEGDALYLPTGNHTYDVLRLGGPMATVPVPPPNAAHALGRSGVAWYDPCARSVRGVHFELGDFAWNATGLPVEGVHDDEVHLLDGEALNILDVRDGALRRVPLPDLHQLTVLDVSGRFAMLSTPLEPLGSDFRYAPPSCLEEAQPEPASGSKPAGLPATVACAALAMAAIVLRRR